MAKTKALSVEVSRYGATAAVRDHAVYFSRRHTLSTPASECEIAARKLHVLTVLLSSSRGEVLCGLNDEDIEHVLYVLEGLASEVHVLAMLAEEVESAARNTKDVGLPANAQPGEFANG